MVPVEKKNDTVDDKFRSITTYNGGTTDNYSWSQDITAVVVEMPLKVKTRAKHVSFLFRIESF